MIQLSEKTKGVIVILFVFVVLPLCMSLRVQQLEGKNVTNTVAYYEK